MCPTEKMGYDMESKPENAAPFFKPRSIFRPIPSLDGGTESHPTQFTEAALHHVLYNIPSQAYTVSISPCGIVRRASGLFGETICL